MRLHFFHAQFLISVHYYTFCFIDLGAEIKPYALCHAKNIYCTIRCKNCGKPRGIFLVGGTKINNNDKQKVNTFLECQSQNYTCGMDFSDVVATIDFDKSTSRPYCATCSGNLVLSCLHPVDEKVSSYLSLCICMYK